MRKLILFLIRYSIVFLFLILEIISFAIYVNNERFAKSVFFSSSNTVVAALYSASNSVVEFFKLKATNQELSRENAELKNNLFELENKLMALQNEDTVMVFPSSISFRPEYEYRFIPAKIINNSTNKSLNFITLNKGSQDGIRPDMGVVAPDGVVGIVKTVSDRFSVVVSVLNSMIHINTKIVRNNYAGPLVWDGEDYRYADLKDIPRHVDLRVGDTLVTSGLTTTFPEGIPVGVIESFTLNEGDAYYDIRVELAVNFRVISQVHVVDYLNYEEQKEIEKTIE